LVHRVVSVWDVSGCYGRQQNDRLLVDEAQESGGDDFYHRWISWRGRVFDKSGAMVEQSVVAANYA